MDAVQRASLAKERDELRRQLDAANAKLREQQQCQQQLSGKRGSAGAGGGLGGGARAAARAAASAASQHNFLDGGGLDEEDEGADFFSSTFLVTEQVPALQKQVAELRAALSASQADVAALRADATKTKVEGTSVEARLADCRQELASALADKDFFQASAARCVNLLMRGVTASRLWLALQQTNTAWCIK
jgi:hypothetical protein